MKVSTASQQVTFDSLDGVVIVGRNGPSQWIAAGTVSLPDQEGAQIKISIDLGDADGMDDALKRAMEALQSIGSAFMREC